MKLLGRILAAIAVLGAGVLLMAGSFWVNFRNFSFKVDLRPAARIQTGGGQDSTDKTVAGGNENQTINNDSGNASRTGAVAVEKKALGETAVPEKLEPAPNKVSAPSIQYLAPAAPDAAPADYTLTREGVIAETNNQRQINLGLGYALEESVFLDQAAQAKVDDMFAGQYFEHVSPQGRDAAYFIGNTGYEYIAIGENLAMGNYKGDAALVKAWMDSPGHRENILKKGFTQIGAAVGYGSINGRMAWLAVQEFGTPESACPTVDEKLSTKIDGEKILLDDYANKQEMYSGDIDMKKDVVEILEEDLSRLTSSSNSYSKIKEVQDKLNTAIREVNLLIDEYNASVAQAKALYEQYKADVEKYNSQVSSYNACIGAI